MYLNSPEPGTILLYPYNYDIITYTYHYTICAFSDQRWRSFDCAFSCTLQQLGISDMSLKTAAQVVAISDVFWEKKKEEFIQLQPDKSVVLSFVMDCKLETTDSDVGWCSASCSV